MKFKEKDPIVSMEQWFPGVVIEDVKEVDIRMCEAKYKVEFKDVRDITSSSKIVSPSRFAYDDGVVSKGALVKIYINGTNGPYKTYLQEYGQNDGLVILHPSDWVLIYQSGRREVLTDKEKQERFE